jgi:hypothetical protein
MSTNKNFGSEKMLRLIPVASATSFSDPDPNFDLCPDLGVKVSKKLRQKTSHKTEKIPKSKIMQFV